jgi:hypothetical protein
MEKCGANLIESERAPSVHLNPDQVLLEAQGVFGQNLQLLPTKIRIKRKGIQQLMVHGLKGDKEIFVDQISGIQFKRSGITSGYMQFSFLGGQETKRGAWDAQSDENTVVFVKKHEPEFEAIKRAVEQRLQEMRSGRMQPTQQTVQVDIPGQIQKLAALKDQGILTEQEFQQKKQELLSKM